VHAFQNLPGLFFNNTQRRKKISRKKHPGIFVPSISLLEKFKLIHYLHISCSHA